MKRVPIQVRVPIISDKQYCCPYEEPFGYIYKITNKFNGHYYIGKHEFHHPWLDETYSGSGEILQRAYKKHGKENFSVLVLEWTDKDNRELNKLEKYWISVFKAFEFPFHYNLTKGGDGNVMCGESHPLYHKGYLVTGKNNPFYGKTHTESSRLVMHERRIQYCKEHNVWNKGMTMSEEFCEKDRLSHLGKKTSQHTKELQSVASAGGRNPMSKEIVQLSLEGEFIAEYSYLGEPIQLGVVGNVDISACCRKITTTAGGFIWMYKSEYQDIIQSGKKIKVLIQKSYNGMRQKRIISLI